ncbi:hypothetical protein ACFCYB_08045 [Streptomyces sp. NPDC056309]|uniref:hypothetical protein n=1 Tax=unclassified Streptomyces TaxID=2593676 RepID=UPI0035DEA159
MPADESPTESIPATTGHGEHADAAQKTTRNVCNQPIGRGKINCSTVSSYAWENKSSRGGEIRTTGTCYSVSIAFLFGAGVEYCSMNSGSDSGSTLSIGPEIGFGASATAGEAGSNVESYKELSGWGVDASFTAGHIVGGYVDGGVPINTPDGIMPEGPATTGPNGDRTYASEAGIGFISGIDASVNFDYTFVW